MLGNEGIVRNIIDDALVIATHEAIKANLHFVDSDFPESHGLAQNLDKRIILLPKDCTIEDVPKLQKSVTLPLKILKFILSQLMHYS